MKYTNLKKIPEGIHYIFMGHKLYIRNNTNNFVRVKQRLPEYISDIEELKKYDVDYCKIKKNHIRDLDTIKTAVDKQPTKSRANLTRQEKGEIETTVEIWRKEIGKETNDKK